ncbi:hypothetical protein ACFODZ_08200 [Marinicella sediminis]|uniref:Uncharacterized protein n=1 Tax=Marinicella sediminis TaxID=1792834 RepID=A0ABV7J7Z4_9GAMM|nr:hypothetical protein [Marinicella sediminis]
MNIKIITVIIISGLLTSTVTRAQQLQDNVEISKSTVDNGGGVSQGILNGDTVVLTGSIGQADAGTESAADNSHFIAGGFWANATNNNAPSDLIFADGFEPN